jgi:signal peptidase I
MIIESSNIISMNKRFIAFLLSLLTPGLGYLQIGDKKSAFKTIGIFFGVIILGVLKRLFTNFLGLILIGVSLITVYLFAAIHATYKTQPAKVRVETFQILKLCLTVIFISITGLSFANKRIVLGFDILRMDVPVMQPTIFKDDKFLIDTWAYKNNLPKRGDIVVHSFNGQQGLYVNRIIAVENDTIEIEDGNVFLNGVKIKEPYVLTANVTKKQSKDMAALIIQRGQYFVMGDNRDASFGDSRFSGTITNEHIIGKPTQIISSQGKSRIGKSLK